MGGIVGTFGGSVSEVGATLTRNLIWDPDTLAWVNATGGATPGANVKVTNFPAAYPVTGTFWPATQPVSGTFWQTTQPVKLVDSTGHEGQFSPMRDLKVTEPFRLVGATFPAANDTNFWAVANSGTASATAVNVIATLTSGTANNGYGQITSVRSGRFIFAHPNLWRGIIRVTDETVAASKRRWGAFTVSTATPQNGFFFEIDGAGVLSVCRASGASISRVASGSFNGAASTYTMDTNAHAYEIIYFIADVHFYIDGVLIHTLVPTTVPLSGEMTLPCTATSVNDADGTTSAVLEAWAMTIIRLGKDKTESRSTRISTNTTTVLKVGAGTLHHVVVNNPTNNAITIYDNTSANAPIIALIAPGAVATPFTLDYDTPFFTGLTIVTAGSPDLTVMYE